MLKPIPAPPDLTGHFCAIPGCSAFGPFGFGPPGASTGATVRWYCGDHAEAGKARWAEVQASGGAAGPTIGQGSLF